MGLEVTIIIMTSLLFVLGIIFYKGIEDEEALFVVGGLFCAFVLILCINLGLIDEIKDKQYEKDIQTISRDFINGNISYKITETKIGDEVIKRDTTFFYKKDIK